MDAVSNRAVFDKRTGSAVYSLATDKDGKPQALDLALAHFVLARAIYARGYAAERPRVRELLQESRDQLGEVELYFERQLVEEMRAFEEKMRAEGGD